MMMATAIGKTSLETERERISLLTNNSDIGDPTEAPGFVIHSLLHSIELQIQTLKRLSRPLQEATPDAKNEVVNVARLVEKTAQYFGSDVALKFYSIDPRFAGRQALDEAHFTSGIM